MNAWYSTLDNLKAISSYNWIGVTTNMKKPAREQVKYITDARWSVRVYHAFALNAQVT